MERSSVTFRLAPTFRRSSDPRISRAPEQEIDPNPVILPSASAVSCCSFRANEGLACLGSVFTLPAYRRRHYAQHLVYRVTETVRSLGFLPMLYTDAGYPASNACYEKIGYALRGRLCTVAALNREG